MSVHIAHRAAHISHSSGTTSSPSPSTSPEPVQRHAHNTGASANVETKLLSELSNDLSSFVNETQWSDVSFVVGGELGGETETFHAHRFILAARSRPFAALLFGQMREGEGAASAGLQSTGSSARKRPPVPIPIPNISPPIFLQLLRYIYAGVVVIEPDNVLPLLQAADQYDVRHLRELCISYALSNVRESSVFTLWETSRVMGLEDLERKCCRFIANHASSLMKEAVVTELSEDTFGELLRLDSLHNVDEIHLFKCLLAWTKKQCRERGLDLSNSKNLQLVGGSLARHLRLPLIPAKDIVGVVEPSGLLSLKQCYWALAYQSTGHVPRKAPDNWLQPRNQVTPAAAPWKWDKCHPLLRVAGNEITRTGDENGHHSAMSNTPFISGRSYFEVSLAQLSRTGSDFVIIGLVREVFNPSTYVGGCPDSWGYSIRSVKYHSGKDSYYGQVCNEGDTIGVMYDSIRGEITFFRNRITMGVAFSDVSGVVYPAVTLYTPSDRVTVFSDVECPV
eukprot:TRINITY_DN7813_c0_g1_i1.p1 TRINITY_DN7813_c0_g1~~TRINITY_DN7813_c0_g1_i1.p1  ORF type:complete len:508 (-),score=155.19 TRINITY_DN7813_c0_g1_i1:157-1680(-)